MCRSDTHHLLTGVITSLTDLSSLDTSRVAPNAAVYTQTISWRVGENDDHYAAMILKTSYVSSPQGAVLTHWTSEDRKVYNLICLPTELNTLTWQAVTAV